MKRFARGLLLLGLPALLYAQVQQSAAVTKVDSQPAQSLSLLSLQLAPGLEIPVGASSQTFGMGGGMRLGAEYRLPFLPLIYFSGDLGYDYDTATGGVPLSVSVTSLSLGGGLRMDLVPWLAATAGFSGGYFFSFLNDFSTSGGNPFVSARAGLIFLPGSWHISVGASYNYYFGLYSGLSASAGLVYDLASPVRGPPRYCSNSLPRNRGC